MPRPYFTALQMVAATVLGALPLFAASDLPDVVAKVDGDPILRVDVLRVFDGIVLASGLEPSKLTPEGRTDATAKVVQEIINDRLLTRASKDVVVSDAEVDQRFEELKRSFTDETVFREELIKGGQTEAGVRDNLRTALKQERWLASQVADKITVTPPEVEKVYRESSLAFTSPEMVRASHILIQIYPGATEAVIAEKQRQIKTLADRLIKGEAFAPLARQFSEDAVTREAGGDLGYFAKDDVDPAFGNAVFKMKVGDIVSPVRTKIGIHIIQLTGRRPAEPIPLDQLRGRIANLIQVEKRKEALKKLLESLREKAKIEIFLAK